MAVRKYIKEKEGTIPSLDRFILRQKINEISSKDYQKRDKALAAFLYLSGCRVEEVVKYKVDGKIVGYPIAKKQVEIQNNIIKVHNVRNLKVAKANRNKYRIIPIIINDLEKDFIHYFLDYLNSLNDEDYLFNITRQRVSQIFEPLGLFPHYLRHCRLTHLTVDYDFNAQQLQHFTGWTGMEMAKAYIHLKVDDLINKMIKIN